MSIEKSNFNFGSNVKKSSMSDRNYLLRTQGRSSNWTHDSVKRLIEAKIQDEQIKQKMLQKLNKCPDGALESFVLNMEINISKIIEESLPKQEKKNLKKKLDTITMDDIIAMRNTISEEAKQEQGKDDLPPTDPNFV
jgi:hypothetical protein